MKKLILGIAGLACTAVFAGMNNLVITFSTPGPDKYADGATVLDGERYSLVWTGADGTQETWTFATAKDGRCTTCFVNIDESKVSSYENGTWSVYLLDTRDFAADATGKTLAGVDEETGKVKKVNTSAPIGDAFTATGGTFASGASNKPVASSAFDLSEVPDPKVTGIEIVGANVIVTVKNTVPFVKYTLVSGDDVTEFSIPEGAVPSNGAVDEGEIKLMTPKKDGAQFFKVTNK